MVERRVRPAPLGRGNVCIVKSGDGQLEFPQSTMKHRPTRAQRLRWELAKQKEKGAQQSQTVPTGTDVWQYTKRIGLSLALVASAFSLLTPAYFWVGVGLFYVGVVLLGIDICSENFFKNWSSSQKVAFAIAYLLILGLFSRFWLFRPAPVEIRAISTVPIYGPGSVVNGIEWSDAYSELRFSLKNPSGTDYDDLDVEISTDLIIEAVGRVDGLASCVAVPLSGGIPFTIQPMQGGVPVGPVAVSPPGGADQTYRIRCEKLPARSQNDFVVALSVFNPFVNGIPPAKLYGPRRVASWFTAKLRFSTLARPRSVVISQCKMGQTCED